ncbi:MAG: hypothetical protein SGBAC_007964 [Bacillariaceae sp.]
MAMQRILGYSSSSSLFTVLCVLSCCCVDLIHALASPPAVSDRAVALNKMEFPRTWVPIASTYELDPNRPTPVEFLGQTFATYQDNDGNWVVLDDACPHRLAPFSEGRVDRDTGRLQCSYHGWEFNSQGKCMNIRQMAPEMQEQVPAKRSCATTYPAQVVKNILFVWPWEEDCLSVLGNPDAQPEGILKGLPEDPPTYTRDLPYGWDTLVENLIDPSHVPFAHHGMQGKRTDAIPIKMTVPEVSETGFSFEWEDRTMGMMRSGGGEFRAPYLVNYDAKFQTETPKPFRLSAICIPTKPGWSRGIIVTWQSEDNEKADKEEMTNVESTEVSTAKEQKKKKKSLMAKVFSNLPIWLSHQLSNKFLDSDLAFLHFQEQERGKRADYFMPAPADRCISALRKWVDKYTSEDVVGPLPPSLPRSAMFDRWTQHTSHCKHCQEGLMTLQKIRRSSYATLALSILGINKHWAPKITALLSLAVWRIVTKLENSFREGEFKHYENH